MKPKIFFGNLSVMADIHSDKMFKMVLPYLKTKEAITRCKENSDWYNHPFEKGNTLSWMKRLPGYDLTVTVQEQWDYLPNLLVTFPDTEFVIATNSPFIIGSVEAELFQIQSDNTITKIEQSAYGLDVNSILRDIMGEYIRVTDKQGNKK